jgi:hypothetical protein
MLSARGAEFFQKSKSPQVSGYKEDDVNTFHNEDFWTLDNTVNILLG